MKIRNLLVLTGAFIMLLIAGGCNESKSYSELLTEEEHAVNWFLAKYQIITEIPSDGKFITGKDAPFYKMKSDGSVYMRVINAGDESLKAEDGDRVYFSFMRANIKEMYDTDQEVWEGNADNLGINTNSTSFVLGNTTLTSTTQYGTGIQLPMRYLGLYSQVELVIKSTEGMTIDQSNCYPYVYKVRYFPAIY